MEDTSMQDFQGSFVRSIEGNARLRYDVTWKLIDDTDASVFDVSVVLTGLEDSTVKISYPAWALGVFLFEKESDFVDPIWNSRTRIDPGTGQTIAWHLAGKNKELNPSETFSPPEFHEVFEVGHLFVLDSLAEGEYAVEVALELDQGEHIFDAESVVLRR